MDPAHVALGRRFRGVAPHQRRPVYRHAPTFRYSIRAVCRGRDLSGCIVPANSLPSLQPLITEVEPFPLAVPVVALVTSAGGLDALTHVLGPLPADLPAAVVIAQHLEPARPAGRLADILDHRTALPVRAARDGDRLQRGVALVVPPGTHMIAIPTGMLALIDTGDLPPARPSADLLLATLAVTAGPLVLAVVLTGRGHDAQAGIRAVRRCGGTVLAQDEATSQHFGMPEAAIATGDVQAVHPLSDLAAAIMRHLARVGGLV